MKEVLLVHYSEIGTKGKNRSFFENRLREDIQRRLCPQHAAKVRLASGRVLAELAPGCDKTAVAAEMEQVFGVAWYAFAAAVPREWPAILDQGLACAGKQKQARTFKVFCKRADKTFPLSSQTVCDKLGQAVVDRYGLKVDLDNHDLALHVEILPETALVYSKRCPGLRGMPRGSSGRLLCLFSGGIDSPVAAWSLMRRGASVDLLHFHPFREGRELMDSKIPALHKILRTYNPSCRLYLIPHFPYQVKAALEAAPAYEMVLFRKFMLKTAAAFARRLHYHGLIAGDSLGQVASQTAENIAAADDGVNIPVFRPLISWDKDDIVRAAQKINTYEPSILPYKDCCSLMSRHPKTAASVERIRRLEETIELNQVVNEALNLVEFWNDENIRPFRVSERSAPDPMSVPDTR